MTAADTRPVKFGIDLPLGYQKTITFRFWADVVYNADGRTVDTGQSTPEDLSGWTAWTTTVKRAKGSPLTLTTTPAGALVSVYFPDTLAAQQATWELKATDPTSRPVPLLSGPLRVGGTAAFESDPVSVLTVDIHSTATVDVIRIGGGSGSGGGVETVNGKPGPNVILTADDLGGAPGGYARAFLLMGA